MNPFVGAIRDTIPTAAQAKAQLALGSMFYLATAPLGYYGVIKGSGLEGVKSSKEVLLETRSKFRAQLRTGKLNKKIIEIDLLESPSGGGVPTLDIPGMPGSQVGMINLNEILGKGMGQKKKKKKMAI